MRTPPTTVLACVLLLLLASVGDAGAYLARDRLEIRTEIVVNATAGPPQAVCQDTAQVADRGERAWRVTLAHPSGPAEGDRSSARMKVSCEPLAGTADGAPPPTGSPGLVREITARWSLTKLMEGEQVLMVDTRWTPAVAPVASGAAGGPGAEPPASGREIFFADDAEVFIPVAIGNPEGAAGPGFREVLLGVRVTSRADDSLLYGTIEIRSDAEGATVLLDGGPAGTVGEDGRATLRNVAAGLREVGVRDPSGSESLGAVRVRPGRTALVDLEAPGSRKIAVPMRLIPAGINDKGFEEFQRPVDGATVVRIPGGEFLMGNTDAERKPHEHRVHVSEFLMDKTGVTWAQYRRFAAATGTSLPLHTPYWGMHADHPAVYVTWEEAKSYCEWAGGRLPTEAEREKAARGTDERKYPWGNEEPDPDRGVFRHTWGQEATGAVGIRPLGASPYGVLDMGGNVWEWCADWYSDEYYLESPFMDPRGPERGRARALRGGSWDSRPTVLSASCRNWGYYGYREGDFGFRCAMNSPGAGRTKGSTP